jgi:hypothetical protein
MLPRSQEIVHTQYPSTGEVASVGKVLVMTPEVRA